MAESSLSIGYAELRIEIGFFLGYGRTIANWETAQATLIDVVFQSGVRRVYFPPSFTEIIQPNGWSFLNPTTTIAITAGDGDYDLPDDFGYMIPQTGWERAENVPLGGPLSPQQWAYLFGRDLVSFTIYASFRIMENKFNIFPQPPPNGLDIFFEYISREWVSSSAGGGDPDGDTVTRNDDIVLFKPVMIVQYLRFKFLDAKGFNSVSASQAFAKAWDQATEGNKSAPVLNAGRRAAGIHYLDFRNIPNTNYGGP